MNSNLDFNSPEMKLFIKNFKHMLHGYKPIKRTRKRQLRRAKFMDHTSYEWSQWWPKPVRKPKRWK